MNTIKISLHNKNKYEFLVDSLMLYIERIDTKFVIELKIIYIKKQLFCNFYFAYILLTLNGN
jgi:hypothetical protein